MYKCIYAAIEASRCLSRVYKRATDYRRQRRRRKERTKLCNESSTYRRVASLSLSLALARPRRYDRGQCDAIDFHREERCTRIGSVCVSVWGYRERAGKRREDRLTAVRISLSAARVPQGERRESMYATSGQSRGMCVEWTVDRCDARRRRWWTGNDTRGRTICNDIARCVGEMRVGACTKLRIDFLEISRQVVIWLIYIVYYMY